MPPSATTYRTWIVALSFSSAWVAIGRELGESLRVKQQQAMGERALERLPGLRDR